MLLAADKYRKKTAFQIFRDNGVYDQVSYAEFGRRAKIFAALLRDKGIKQGDRVMILAENRPEWPIAYFGIALAGAISVPVLVDFIEDQICAIADHAEISAICVTERTAAKAADLQGSIDSANPLKSKKPISFFMLDDADLYNDRVRSEICAVPEKGDEEDIITSGAPASIIYTSGTTGVSKGVTLSHENLVFTTLASRKLLKLYSRDRILSVIPLAHTYECTVGLLAAIVSGASVTYLDRPPSPVILLPAMQCLRPTAMVTVPLFIEKIYRANILPKLETKIFYKWKITRFFAVRIAGANLMLAMGGALRFFGIGGAPLAEDAEIFLKAAAFPYSIGYGLTETSPLVTGTTPYRFTFRSAGKPIPGVELRIGTDGEIQIRGPNVMMGYYRDAERTRQAFTDDGWLKTGDLGYLDRKGSLFIRGRSKALILGPSGENIYPEEIENLLYTSLLVEDALVVQGSKNELTALVVPSEKAPADQAVLADKLDELKQSVNKRLPAFSRLKIIVIQNEAFEKTPTRKIKRFMYTQN